MIDDGEKTQALESGIITLTGGHTLTGSLILTIPTSKLEELSEWRPEKLASLFLYLTSISRYVRSPRADSSAVPQIAPLACMADLRHASVLTIKQLTEGLEAVEHQQRGTVSAVYFLKPRSKTRSHILKKLLGVKPSKKRPRVPLFKIVLMKTIQEVHAYIDASQLTADFYGTLRYDHGSWIHLYNVVIKCIESCHDLLTKLPSVRDKVELLQEYETEGQSSGQVQQLLADLLEKFHIILSDSTLPSHLTLSKQTLFLLDHPSSDSQLSLVHPELTSGLKSHLRGIYSQLDQWNTDLEDAWRVTENSLNILIQFHKHRERAKEIERKISEHYQPLFREHPVVGKTLSQAELYRTHFTTTLYDPAKELLSQATEILEAVQKLKGSLASLPPSGAHRQDSTISHSGIVISDQDISDISKFLNTSIQPFTTQLQQLQQLYVNIHIFHLLFEKALIWYKKVLKFMPESLLQRCSIEPDLKVSAGSLYNLSSQAKETWVCMPAEWLRAVRVFLSRHPPPRQEHIDRLDEGTPHLVDRKMRSQARSLALRLRLVYRVLTSTRLPLKLVVAVLAWREELFGLSQQERIVSTLQNGPSKAASSGIIPGNSKEQGSEKTLSAYLDQARPRSSRAPQKPPRTKRLSTTDRENHNRTRPAEILSGESTSEAGKPLEKPPIRRYSTKGMLRSKSVDFNFNSSSTDGSVFDYDNALIQSERQTVTAEAKTQHRKSYTSSRDAKSPNQFTYLKVTQSNEQALSDSSELESEQLGSRTINQDGAPGHLLQNDEETHLKLDVGNEESGHILNDQSYKQGRSTLNAGNIPDREPAHIVKSSSHNHEKLARFQQRKNKPIPLDQNVMSQSSDERFIRITYTPQQTNSNRNNVFRFGSDTARTGSSIAEEKSGAIAEEKSGVDLTTGTDPYEDVVKMIKEISSSNLNNLEKLKQVTELLSLGTLEKQDSPKPLSSTLKASKTSLSTMDLRSKAFQQHDDSDDDNDDSRMISDFKSESSSLKKNLGKTETPIEAVQQMKKNLARSMEELNLSTSFPKLRERKTLSSGKNSVALSKNKGGVRYLSELKIQPLYNKAHEVAKEIADARLGFRYRSMSDIDAPEYISQQPRGERNTGSQCRPNIESVIQSCSVSESNEDSISGTPQRSSLYLDSPVEKSNDKSITSTISKFIPEDPTTENYSQDIFTSNESRKPAVSKPTSLNLFSKRNFISPSFLRPASSMNDISTRVYPPLNFNIGMDFEEDYQVLEDLHILQSLQDDAFCNQFSKYSSQRKLSSDHLMEEPEEEFTKREDLHLTEHHYQTLSFEKESSQNVEGSNSSGVPEIRIGYLTEHWPNFDDDIGCLPYTQNPKIDFDRLTIEADQEHLSQEEVANSLKKTQKILEEEEARRLQGLDIESDLSFDEAEGSEFQGAAGGLSHTTSLDNGYGSWASKLICSTSSEGTAGDVDYLPERDWRKLSSSSTDSGAKPQWSKEAIVKTKSAALEDQPLTDPELY